MDLTKWYDKQALLNTLSGFGSQTGPGGASVQGMYNSITDPFRIAAHGSNKLQELTGLRSNAEAQRAANQIQQAFTTIPFVSENTNNVFRQSTKEYPITNFIGNVTPQLLGGQLLLKSGLKGLSKLDHYNALKQSINRQFFGDSLNEVSNNSNR
jgi:hypothetical protein